MKPTQGQKNRKKERKTTRQHSLKSIIMNLESCSVSFSIHFTQALHVCMWNTSQTPHPPPPHNPYAHSHMHTRTHTFVKHGRSPNRTSIWVRNQERELFSGNFDTSYITPNFRAWSSNFSWGGGDCFQFTSKFWIPFGWVRGPCWFLFFLLTKSWSPYIYLYTLPHPAPQSWSHHNGTLRKSKHHLIWRGDWVATKHYITRSFIRASCITLATYFLMFCQAPSLIHQLPNPDFSLFFNFHYQTPNFP
jgi:hypothetical protein